ncbi:MAG: hypothetical protein AAF125_17010 [Chloroflexota bacterium]
MITRRTRIQEIIGGTKDGTYDWDALYDLLEHPSSLVRLNAMVALGATTPRDHLMRYALRDHLYLTALEDENTVPPYNVLQNRHMAIAVMLHLEYIDGAHPLYRNLTRFYQELIVERVLPSLASEQARRQKD